MRFEVGGWLLSLFYLYKSRFGQPQTSFLSLQLTQIYYQVSEGVCCFQTNQSLRSFLFYQTFSSNRSFKSQFKSLSFQSSSLICDLKLLLLAERQRTALVVG